MQAMLTAGAARLTTSAFITLSAAVALAGAPRVDFDTASTVACRELTTESFSQMHPGERLWEARFEISSLMRNGDEDDLIQFFLRIESPARSIRVIDYEPKTTLSSSLAGNVGVQTHRERSKSLGLAVTGSFESIAKVTGNGSVGAKDVTDVRYEMLPPKQLVASSGTIHRGAGAYFKLKPTRQSTLEGGKQYVLVFRTPQDWRADMVSVHCEALTLQRGLTPLLNDQVTRRQSFSVVLYAGGDASAKLAAERLPAAEQNLRSTAQKNRAAIRKRAYPSPAHQLGAMLSLVDARIPANWLDQLVARPTGARKIDLLRLPEDVRVAANHYVTAARQIEQLRGGLANAK